MLQQLPTTMQTMTATTTRRILWMHSWQISAKRPRRQRQNPRYDPPRHWLVGLLNDHAIDPQRRYWRRGRIRELCPSHEGEGCCCGHIESAHASVWWGLYIYREKLVSRKCWWAVIVECQFRRRSVCNGSSGGRPTATTGIRFGSRHQHQQ